MHGFLGVAQAYSQAQLAEAGVAASASDADVGAAATVAPRDASEYTPPPWAGPPSGVAYSVEVMKSGTIVEQRPVEQKDHYTFGRAPNNGETGSPTQNPSNLKMVRWDPQPKTQGVRRGLSVRMSMHASIRPSVPGAYPSASPSDKDASIALALQTVCRAEPSASAVCRCMSA
jgi:hypothetical protein